MNKSLLGLAILGLVALVAVGASLIDFGGLSRSVSGPEPVKLSIYYGGEKSALLKNPAVQDILQDRYKITLDAAKAGSIEMVAGLDSQGKDCLWPSNMVAVELARAGGKTVLGDQTIFNSPIVFYAWSDVTKALEAQGLVTRSGDMLTADIDGIGALVAQKARWREDLGLNIYGPFRVFSTHPAKSNSGNIWSALLATALNGGTVPTAADLPVLLPKLDAYFDAMGYMEASSGDIFGNFLKQGMGARPLIVGYENQLVEFLRENAGYKELIEAKIDVIYPAPTIFASHPLIALTPACKRLEQALMDPELQDLAWSGHGFRTGLVGALPTPASALGLPETVSLVVPMPGAEVVQAIIRTVSAAP